MASLRAENVKLLTVARIDRVGERGGEKVIFAVVDDIGRNGHPLVHWVRQIRARQQVKLSAKLTEGFELQIGFAGDVVRQQRQW